jgi:hypothetical protein
MTSATAGQASPARPGQVLTAGPAGTRRRYHRHGYVLRPDAPIRLPGSGPAMWPMWREPHPPAGPVFP